jgi:hypothetical protein
MQAWFSHTDHLKDRRENQRDSKNSTCFEDGRGHMERNVVLMEDMRGPQLSVSRDTGTPVLTSKTGFYPHPDSAWNQITQLRALAKSQLAVTLIWPYHILSRAQSYLQSWSPDLRDNECFSSNLVVIWSVIWQQKTNILPFISLTPVSYSNNGNLSKPKMPVLNATILPSYLILLSQLLRLQETPHAPFLSACSWFCFCRMINCFPSIPLLHSSVVLLTPRGYSILYLHIYMNENTLFILAFMSLCI